MTLIQMLYFYTVCEYMSFTKAAEKLRISQPALSSAIRQVEEKCGVELFKHRANSISITDERIVLRQPIYLIWRKDRPLFHAARHFVETAQEIYGYVFRRYCDAR